MPALVHLRSCLLVSLCLAVTSLALFAQQGDRKGHQMTDPIPADKIPPSPYLSLKEALKSFKLAPGYVIEPVAVGSNVDLVVALSFDGNGRAWTCEMRSYMPDIDGKGEMTPNGRIRVLEDTTGDGVLDKATTFLDHLILPRAVAVTSDGCLYTSRDSLYFTKRNGLKPTGKPMLVDKDYAKGGNPEHKANGLIYGHDNWYYSAKSSKRYRRINGKWVQEDTNFRGQWGISKDNVGRLFHNNNSTLLMGDQFRPQFFRGKADYTPKHTMAARLGNNKVHPIRITPGVNRGYLKNTLDRDGKLANATAACGPVIYRGDNFPQAMQEMGFICEPSGDLVKAVKVKRDALGKPSGSHPYGDHEFLASTDEWFLPCNLYTGPDGTLWMVDMYFGLLQHKVFMTTYLRKQYLSRGLDKPKASTGRIYRIRYAKKAASPTPLMEGLPASKLITFLRHANGLHRDTAQRLIVESGDRNAVDQLVIMAQDRSHPLAQIHALWTMDGLGHVSVKALSSALKSHHPDVIATALDIVSVRRPTDQALIKDVISLTPSNHILHSLVRALVAVNQPSRAIELIRTYKKTKWLREAFVSGLGAEQKTHGKTTGDPALDALISAANKGAAQVKITSGAHLAKSELGSFKRGESIYTTKAACFACHGGDGKGMDRMGPPLNHSEWVTGDTHRLTQILLHGLTGPIKVAGQTYSPPLAMPGLAANPAISDQDLADVMTYIRNSWENKAKAVTQDTVRNIRARTRKRTSPYTTQDLK